MIEKFNSIFYLILFSIHFLGLGFYAYQMIIDNKRYREKFQIDETNYRICIVACLPNLENAKNLYSLSLNVSVSALYSPTSHPEKL